MKRGNCYRIAGNMVIERPEFILCHGIVAGQGELEGMWIGHAWCEHGDIVFDFSNGKEAVVWKEKYYKIGKITKVKKYSSKEAREMMLAKGNYGPWDTEVTMDWQIRH